jgi:hypothetical protein
VIHHTPIVGAGLAPALGGDTAVHASGQAQGLPLESTTKHEKDRNLGKSSAANDYGNKPNTRQSFITVKRLRT